VLSRVTRSSIVRRRDERRIATGHLKFSIDSSMTGADCRLVRNLMMTTELAPKTDQILVQIAASLSVQKERDLLELNPLLASLHVHYDAANRP